MEMKKKGHLLALLMCMTGPAFAVSMNLSSTNYNVEKDSKLDSVLTGDFAFQYSDFVEDVGDVTGNRHHGSLNIQYKSFSDENVYKSLHLKSRINDQEVLQYSIKEALVEKRYSNSRLALGRTTLNWSYQDQIWGLGKINNRVNFDYFEPGQEGLVGVFYDKKYKNGFDISAFGSFVYIPELSQGMVIDKDKGTITCKTKWCNAPNASAEIQDKDVPIYYDVNYPDVSDVVQKYSVGLKVGYTYGPLHMNTFALRKPENSLSVLAEVVAEPDLSVINVEVTPQFYYHDVRGGNVELSLNDHLKIYGSGVSVNPNSYPDGERQLIEYTGIKPNKKAEDYLGGGAIYNDGDIKAHAGYIARVSDFDIEEEVLVEYPRWNQAMHLAFSKNITRKLFVGLDYKYDMLTEDRLTMFKSSYSVRPSVVATFGVNIIGTNEDKDSFWSKYENNDSVYSSLKYTF